MSRRATSALSKTALTSLSTTDTEMTVVDLGGLSGATVDGSSGAVWMNRARSRSCGVLSAQRFTSAAAWPAGEALFRGALAAGRRICGDDDGLAADPRALALERVSGSAPLNLESVYSGLGRERSRGLISDSCRNAELTAGLRN